MQPTSPTQTTSDAPWLARALGYVGRHERVGGKLSEWVRALFKWTRFPRHLINLRTAWCAAFACTVLEESGVPSPNSARARDFLRWGIPILHPIPGALCVFTRGGPMQDTGHVAFCTEPPRLKTVRCVGGNQDNQVSIADMRLELLIGVRWPVGVPLPPEAVRI